MYDGLPSPSVESISPRMPCTDGTSDPHSIATRSRDAKITCELEHHRTTSLRLNSPIRRGGRLSVQRVESAQLCVGAMTCPPPRPSVEPSTLHLLLAPPGRAASRQYISAKGKRGPNLSYVENLARARLPAMNDVTPSSGDHEVAGGNEERTSTSRSCVYDAYVHHFGNVHVTVLMNLPSKLEKTHSACGFR